MIVACVLKTGGIYRAEDVERLEAGVLKWLPGASFACLTDATVSCVSIQLKQNWPGWWSKMELFDPSMIDGDILYFDLDTMLVGSLDEIAAVSGPVVMRDVYRPKGLQSSVMFIPHSEKAAIWQAFTKDPAGHMARCTTADKWGDQGFIEEHWLSKAKRWQDILPGQIVSYRADSITKNARVVVFHGRPKPRDIGWKL